MPRRVPMLAAARSKMLEAISNTGSARRDRVPLGCIFPPKFSSPHALGKHASRVAQFFSALFHGLERAASTRWHQSQRRSFKFDVDDGKQSKRKSGRMIGAGREALGG